ncbi:GAF and ANTAR domain-containing protein [Microlunatus ginsengisoli]|uniref:GAF and ANTAR domain-containing protein n=1 Tax=Microlunatus ginsengisoli TaxID=363863 RepID=UPI0031D885C0
MTVQAAVAAADRATSAAARLAALRERAGQLSAGGPISIEHLLEARAWAEAQRGETERARRRLVASHLAAADRHDAAARVLDQAGKTERAERLRRIAQQHARAAEDLSAAPDGDPAVEQLAPEAIHREAAAATEPAQTADRRLEFSPHTSIRDITDANRRLARLLSSVGWSRSRIADSDRVRDLWRAIALECVTGHWRGWSQAVCDVGTGRLPTVSGIAITAFDGSIHQPLAASDDWTESVEEIQQLIGDGPSLTAYQQRRRIVVDDLSSGYARWPGFVSASARTGLSSVWALPVEVDRRTVGVITFYRKHAGPAARSEWSEAEAVADAAVTAFVGDVDDLAGLSAANELTASAMVVHIATGIIATRLAITPAEALTRLRAQAFASNRRLRSVAELVVDGTLTSW